MRLMTKLIRVKADTHKELKIRAAKKGVSIQKIVEELLKKK